MVIGYGWRVTESSSREGEAEDIGFSGLSRRKKKPRMLRSRSRPVKSFHFTCKDLILPLNIECKQWFQSLSKKRNSDISTSNEMRNRLSSGRKVKRISQIINCTVYMSCQSAHKQDTEMINMSNLHRSSNWKHLWGQRCSNSLQFSETCQRIKARLASTPRCNLNWNV